jgi:hypothetical protein
MRTAALGILLVWLISMPALAGPVGPLDGHVINGETGEPIAGAIVAAKWLFSVSDGLADSSNVCSHVETVVSDAAGRYHFDARSEPWYGIRHYLFTNSLGITVHAYKRGFTWHQEHGAGPWQQFAKERALIPFRGTVAERFEFLDRVVSNTSCGGESSKNLYRLYSALYEEANFLAETPQQRKSAQNYSEFAEYELADRTKPTITDHRGVLINVDPKDSYKKEDLLK